MSLFAFIRCRPLLFPASLLTLFAMVGCSGRDEKKAPAAKPTVPVRAVQAVAGKVPVELQLFGTVEAKSTVPVKAQVSGQLRQVHFREGDEVRQGELLFTVDPRPFEVALQQAEAALARDRAAQQQARQQAERYTQLLAQGYVSQQEHDQIQSNSAGLDATLAIDQAAIASARLQLDYCRIIAPLSGRTGSLSVHPGALVKANDGDALVVIHQLQPINVSFTAPERDFERIRAARARGKLEVQAGDGGLSRGTLDFVDNAVDTATGTIRLKATFANSDRRLWPGAFVRIVIQLGAAQEALVAPAGAVQVGQQGSYVYVVGADGTVSVRPVKAGTEWQGMTAIEEGLVAGETIVVDGQSRLYPGARVTTETPAAPKKP